MVRPTYYLTNVLSSTSRAPEKRERGEVSRERERAPISETVEGASGKKKRGASFSRRISGRLSMLISWASETCTGRAIYHLGPPAVVLVVLPVLLQLRRRLADEARLVEVPLDRAPDLPAVKHRRAPVVQQWRVLAHHVQQMQPFRPC